MLYITINKFYVIHLHYIVELDELDQKLIAHRNFLDKHYNDGVFIMSGPQTPRSGGIILAAAPDRATLMTIIKDDPFYTACYAEYTLTECQIVKHAPAFNEIIDKFHLQLA